MVMPLHLNEAVLFDVLFLEKQIHLIPG